MRVLRAVSAGKGEVEMDSAHAQSLGDERVVIFCFCDDFVKFVRLELVEPDARHDISESPRRNGGVAVAGSC